MDDLISRLAAMDALIKDKKELEHIINGMSRYEKEFADELNKEENHDNNY